MCKVYEFPNQLELPKEEKEILELIGEAYAKALYNSLVKLVSRDATLDEMEEVRELVNQAFTQGMNKAVEDFEGS